MGGLNLKEKALLLLENCQPQIRFAIEQVGQWREFSLRPATQQSGILHFARVEAVAPGGAESVHELRVDCLHRVRIESEKKRNDFFVHRSALPLLENTGRMI